MICPDCAEAADQHAGREAHCDADGGPDSACDCAHRVDRYRSHADTPIDHFAGVGKVTGAH